MPVMTIASNEETAGRQRKFLSTTPPVVLLVYLSSTKCPDLAEAKAQTLFAASMGKEVSIKRGVRKHGREKEEER